MRGYSDPLVWSRPREESRSEGPVGGYPDGRGGGEGSKQPGRAGKGAVVGASEGQSHAREVGVTCSAPWEPRAG